MHARSAIAALLLLAAPSAARALANLPADFDEQVVVSGLDKPTAFVYAPDGRIFFTEKDGRVRVVTADGQLLPTAFATVAVTTVDDLGLIGITLDPDFVNNHYVYLAYTTTITPPNPPTSYSRVHRITRMTANGNVAVPGSEVVIVDNIQSDHTSHLGGALRFGPDGKLYASTGDGASYDIADPLAFRALNVDSLNGKILRLEPDGSAPADNPFYTTPTAIRSKVWQMGLRNPFKATFRPGTAEFYVNDVGWETWEEVNHAGAGASFGWPCDEGNFPEPTYSNPDVFPNPFYLPGGCPARPPVAPPVYAYQHSPGGCATGGAFFEGSNYPAQYVDKYFLTDYAQRWIRYIDVDTNPVTITTFATGADDFKPVDLALGPDGNLQYLNIASDYTIPSGRLQRIVYVGAGNHEPRPVASASPTSGYAPLPVVLTAAGTTDPDGDPLTYHWTFGDGLEANGFTVSHNYAANGSYVAVLQVNDTHVTRQAEVTIMVGSLPPTAKILTPPPYRTYVTDEVIPFSGSATDPDEGTLGENSLHWTVIQHHNTHEHAYLDTTGASGSFIAEGHGAVGETVYYELILTATDASGLSDGERLKIYLNHDPVANAGPDRTAPCDLPPATMALNGAASSDPDNQPIVSYLWTQVGGSAVTLEGSTTAMPSFTAPVIAGGGVLTFQLQVNDGHVSNSDTVSITVPDLNDADGDLAPTCSDCAPLDGAVKPPGASTNLRFGSDKATLTWNAAPGATAHDLHRGSLPTPFDYNHACLRSGVANATAVDTEVPGSGGSGFYYLSRGINSCGPGSLGKASSGSPVPTPPCP